MPVLLFDIDGTLVRAGGAGKAALQAALRRAFDLTELFDGVPFAGRTDPAISRDLLALHNVAVTPANLATLRDLYLEHLPPSLTECGGTVCPGVPELLAGLSRDPAVTLGLLTGNMRAGAEHKLTHFGLWHYFAAGGFGDVHEDRDDVARAAVADVERHLGRGVEPGEVWVIGDTPLDVSCARAIGARAVAVATGWHTLAELEATGADYAVADLTGPVPWRGGSP